MSELGYLSDGDPEPRRRRTPLVLLLALVMLGLPLLAAMGFIAYYSKSVLDGLDSVERDPSLMPTQTESLRPEPAATKEGTAHPPLNIALLGTDSRSESDQGRSDVLILMHVTGDREHAYLISFPRDYWVAIPGHGTAKINAAYAWGGAALTVETLEALTDVRIDHTALIDFDGFSKVIDAVGGITVYNPHESYNGDQHFPEGQISLNGSTALLYVRNRHGLPEGDFDRAQRQRAVTMAVVDKLTSRGVLTNPGKFRDAVTTLGPNFTVDQELTNQRIFDLGLSMRLRGSQDMSQLMAPVAGFGTSSGGQAYVAVDEGQLADLSQALREDTMDEYFATHHS